MAHTFPKLLLVALSAWGFWSLWGFPYKNGLLKLLIDLKEPGAQIPGPTKASMKQTYTGNKILDGQLSILVGFFFTAIDGNRADVSLVGLELAGQVVAAWMLIVIESMRAGNKGKFWITFVTILGLLLQLIGFACIAPLWMALHIATSPTLASNNKSPAPTTQIWDLLVQPVHLAVVPIAILIGYGIPSVMMCLPAPLRLSFEAKQTWAGIQQGWPLWILVFQLVLPPVVATFNNMTHILTEAQKKEKTLKYLRLAYMLALLCAAIGHVISFTLSILAYSFPVLFSQSYLPQLQPVQVFLPTLPFPPYIQAQTVADGALWFLQWDLITGSASTLVWALALRVAEIREQTLLWQWVQGFLKVVVATVALGPCGAAVLAMWQRDELVWERDRDLEAKKKAARVSGKEEAY